jgi:hypothetical protein
MKRRLLDLLTALSLLLCVATVRLWLRGHRVSDAWEAQHAWDNVDGSRGSRGVGLYTRNGRLGLQYCRWHFSRWTIEKHRGRIAGGRGYGLLTRRGGREEFGRD